MKRQFNLKGIIIFCVGCAILIVRGIIPPFLEDNLKTPMMLGGRRVEIAIKILIMVPIISWSLMFCCRKIKVLSAFSSLLCGITLFFLKGDNCLIATLLVQSFISFFLPQFHPLNKKRLRRDEKN